MNLKITISSGKGGTGKTFVSTNLAYVLSDMGKKVTYLDCDVEEPNGHLFLKPDIYKIENINLLSPAEADIAKCIGCGKCADVCRYKAIALIKGKLLFFRNLCHLCGSCEIICPTGAIIKKERLIGVVNHGKAGNIDFHYGLLKTGEGGMTPRLIKRVKENTGDKITILDSPPGTSCPVVETVKDADICVLVTDPTPFGVNDLSLAVDMCRKLDIEPLVLVNRAEYLDNELKEYCAKEELEIIGEIPDERKIAEAYSEGRIAVTDFSEVYLLFKNIAERIIKRSSNKRTAVKKNINAARKIIKSEKQDMEDKNKKPLISSAKEIVIISGKGGTGKTSLTASFCALEKNIAIADCDVDAADLYLILNPEVIEEGIFSGGERASVDPEKCISCGKCFSVCRFDAVKKDKDTGKYFIDEKFCEGCGACGLVCKSDTIKFVSAENGEWYNSTTRFGPMSHAKLGIAEENSGKLVTFIRNKKNELTVKYDIKESISDGSPGTGCPVIASLTGVNYAVVVTEPTVSGVHDLVRIFDLIKFFNIRSGVIVNKYDLNVNKTREIKNIALQYNADFLGTIPYDKSITEAQMKKLSVVEYIDNAVTTSIKEIWEKIKERVY